MIARCNSHRARDKVTEILNRKITWLYSWDDFNSRGLCEVSPEEFEKIKHIKGVTKSRFKLNELRECISFL